MNRNKSTFRRLLPWLILLLAVAALVIFVFIPIFSEKDRSTGREPYVLTYEGDSKPITIGFHRGRFQQGFPFRHAGDFLFQSE